MDLLIRQTVYDIMLAAARRVAPLEACGLLAGRDGHATTCYELVNADASADHYSMRPEEQFAAAKDMRGKGQRLLAIWHSHPASPARMSDEDLRLAYTPGVVYVILSLVRPEAPDVRGFVLAAGVAKEVPVMVAEPHDAPAPPGRQTARSARSEPGDDAPRPPEGGTTNLANSATRLVVPRSRGPGSSFMGVRGGEAGRSDQGVRA